MNLKVKVKVVLTTIQYTHIPDLAYLACWGAYLGALNIGKWDIPEKIIPNANRNSHGKLSTNEMLVRRRHFNYNVKLDVADQNSRHLKERLYSENNNDSEICDQNGTI